MRTLISGSKKIPQKSFDKPSTCQIEISEINSKE